MLTRPLYRHTGLLFGVVTVACIALFLTLQKGIFLKGTDAYYYALQVDWWSRTGHVRIPDSSWIFPLLGGIQRLGLTTEAVLRGFLCASLFLAAVVLFWSAKKASLLRRTASALWIAFSPVLLFTAIEFPKMFVVMALIPLWEVSSNRRRMLISAAAMALAFWVHRSSLAFIGCFALGAWLDRRLKNHTWMWSGLVLLAALTFALGDRSLLMDVQRLLPAVHLSRPGLFSLISRESLPISLKAELTFFAAAFVYFLLQKAFRPESSVPFRYLLAGLTAFLPFGSDDVFSVGERFALFLPLLTLLIWCREDASQESAAGGPPAAFYFLLLAGVFGALAPQIRLDLAHPSALDPDYPEIGHVAQSLSQMEIPMLIAHKDVAFYYKFAAHRESFPYEPEDHWDKKRIWRLVYRMRPDEVWPYLSPECRNSLVREWKDYLLIGEACWYEARQKIGFEEDSDLYERAWNPVWNPSQKRPAFLYPKHRGDQPEEFPALPPKL